MTIFPSGKGVSVTREVFQPTKKTLIKTLSFNTYECNKKLDN